MTDMLELSTQINTRCAAFLHGTTLALDELTLEVKIDQLLNLCQVLRNDPIFAFDQLMDVCGVDYLHYGLDEWQTQSATATGFGRGVTYRPLDVTPHLLRGPAPLNRFSVVYHLLSLNNNQRVRLRVEIPDHHEMMVDSVISIWPAANWYEREAFDMFGILFKGHPDLRRILTDYGFTGHPFRKDFPLIGKVEARYDAALGRVVYEPVSIEPRILEPKVIRHDNRYLVEKEG